VWRPPRYPSSAFAAPSVSSRLQPVLICRFRSRMIQQPASSRNHSLGGLALRPGMASPAFGWHSAWSDLSLPRERLQGPLCRPRSAMTTKSAVPEEKTPQRPPPGSSLRRRATGTAPAGAGRGQACRGQDGSRLHPQALGCGCRRGRWPDAGAGDTSALVQAPEEAGSHLHVDPDARIGPWREVPEVHQWTRCRTMVSLPSRKWSAAVAISS
jgi:hypothetical protein